MIPPYTAFLDGNTGIFLQQKMLSAAQITYSSEQFPPAWRQDPVSYTHLTLPTSDLV